MYIEDFFLENFRNYSRGKLSLRTGIYIVQGANGQGKSNLLEAIHYLCSGRSFRASQEQDMLKWDAPYFYLKGTTVINDRKYLLETGFELKRRRKVYKVNGRVEKDANRSISCPVVFFVPEDLELIRRGPEERRRFMDRFISQMNPLYEGYLRRYYRALFQKNKLLKENMAVSRQKELLAPWAEQLLHFGTLIIRERQLMVNLWGELAAANYHHLFEGAGQLHLLYKVFLGDLPPQHPQQTVEIEERYREEMSKLFPRERERGYALAGPHRDELALLINGREARRFASHGQQRSIALSLKAAQIQLHERKGEKPLFLLDDIFSELDERRREQCFGLLGSAEQVFVTITRKEKYLLPFLEKYPNAAFITVKAGQVRGVESN